MCILHIYEAEFIWSIGLNAIKSVLLWNITTILNISVNIINNNINTLLIFSNVIYSCDAKQNFIIITLNFSVTWSFRNQSNILICCSDMYYYYYQCYKQLCCFNRVETMIDFWINWKFSIYISKQKSFVRFRLFTVTFNQYILACWTSFKK